MKVIYNLIIKIDRRFYWIIIRKILILAIPNIEYKVIEVWFYSHIHCYRAATYVALIAWLIFFYIQVIWWYIRRGSLYANKVYRSIETKINR